MGCVRAWRGPPLTFRAPWVRAGSLSWLMATKSEQAFEVVSEFEPTGDQPAAIEGLVGKIRSGDQYSCLLGATGTGKTFTMAHTIARLGKPALIVFVDLHVIVVEVG